MATHNSLFADKDVRRTDNGLAVSAANLFAFGIVWVVKFVVLEKIMWKQPTLEVVAIDVERA